MREDILAAQPTDPEAVVAALLAPVVRGATVFYQKHMTHHMQPGLPARLDAAASSTRS